MNSDNTKSSENCKCIYVYVMSIDFTLGQRTMPQYQGWASRFVMTLHLLSDNLSEALQGIYLQVHAKSCMPEQNTKHTSILRSDKPSL